MSKTWKLLGLTILGVAFFLVLGWTGQAKAADLTVDGNLFVNGQINAQHNWIKFAGDSYYRTSGIDPTLDFQRGDSQLKEMGDLYLFSDDYTHLGPSKFDIGKVLIQNVAEMQSKSRSASGTIAAGRLEVDTIAGNNNGSLIVAETTSFNNGVTLGDAAADTVTINGNTVFGSASLHPTIDFTNAGTISGLIPADLGLTASVTELNYVDNVTSAIQTQLDARLPLAGGTMSGAINMGGNDITNVGTFSPTTLQPTTLTVSGISTFNGNTVIGSDASDTVQFNALAATALNMNTNIISNIGAAGTDFNATGGLTLADDLNMSAQPIVNIGNASTDFDANGGLTLNDNLVVSGAVTGGGLTITGRATPFATTNGTIYYDTDTNQLNGRINGAWVDLGQTPGAAGNMNAAYENFGAVAALVDVDGGQGQTTGLTFRSNAASDAGDIIINLNNTGDFKVQDAGANYMTFNDDGTATFYGSTWTFGDSANDQVVFTSSIGSNMTFLAGGARTITGPSDNSLTVQGGAAQALNLTSNAASTYQTTVGGLILIGETTAALTAEAGNVTITATGANNDIVLNPVDTIDASSKPIVNIGAAGTDFTATGGLTLADTLTVTAGGATITAGNLAVNSDVITSDGDLAITGATGANLTATLGTLDINAVANTLNLNTINDQAIAIGAGTFTQDAGGGQVIFTGNVNTTAGLDVTGADFTVGGGYGATGVTISDAGVISADGAIISGSTITIDGNDGVDSIVSTHELLIDVQGGDLTLDTDLAASDIVMTPVDDLLVTPGDDITVTLAAGGQMVLDAANADNTTTTGVLSLDVDSLTTGNSAIYANYEVLATAAGTQSVINIPQITNTGSATVANVYGLYMQGISANGAGNNYAIYIPNSEWDYSIYAIDDAYFQGTMDLHGSVDFDGTTFNVDATQGDIDSIVLNASSATGGVDIQSGTNDITMQSDDIILLNATNDVDITSTVDVDNAAGETVTFTTSDSTNGLNYVTINNDQNVDITASTYLLSLMYNANGDAQANYLRLRDEAYGHTVFQIDNGGDTTWTLDDAANLQINSVSTAVPVVDINLDPAGASTAQVLDIDLGTSAVSGNVIDVTFAGAVHTGNAIDLNMGTNVAGDGLNIGLSASTTGNGIEILYANTRTDGSAIEITDSGNATANAPTVEVIADTVTDVDVLKLHSNAQTTGNTLFIDAGASVFTTGSALSIAGSGAYATDVDAALLDVQAAGIAVDGYIAAIIADVATTVDAVTYMSGNALTSGHLLQLASSAARTTGAALLITDDALAAGVANALVQIDVTGTKDDNTIDIDVSGSAATAGNELDITYSGFAHTGNAIDLNMGTNVAGDAINIDSAATTGQAIDLASTGDFQNNLINITSTAAWDGNLIAFDNTGNAVWTGNLFDVATGAADAAGNVIDVAIEALATDVQVLVVNNSSASDQAGWLIDVNTLAAFSGNMIDFNNATNDIWTGNLFSVVTGNAATGDVLSYSSSSISTQVITIENQVANTQQGYAMAVNNQGAFTGSVIYFDDTGDSAWTGNVIDIQTGTGNHTGDIFNVAMEATANNDGQVLVVTNADESDQAGWLLSVDASAAWTANAINFVQSAGVSTADVIAYDNSGDTAVAGDFISYASGTGDVDGDVMDITLEAGATSAQIFDVNNAAVSDEAGWLLEVDTTGAWTGNAMDFDIGTAASTGDLLNVAYTGAIHTGDAIEIAYNSGVSTGRAIYIDNNDNATGHMIFVDSAADRNAGSLLRLDDAASPTASAPTIDVNLLANTDQPGLDIQYANAQNGTGDLIYTDLNDALAAGAFVVNAADGARTDAIVDITTATTGSAADAASIFQINASGNLDALANIVDLNVTGNAASNSIDVTYSAGVATGNAIDLNMGTNVAGDAINIASAATTGNGLVITNTNARTDGSAISIVDSGNATANAATVEITSATLTDVDLMTLTAGTQTTGNTLTVNAGASVFTTGSALSIAGSGAYATDADAALLDVQAAGIAVDGYIAAIIADVATTVDAVTYMSGNALTSGHLLQLESSAARTSGAALLITDDSTAATDDALVQINVTGTKDANTLDIDVSNAGVAAGNELDITYSVGAHTGNAIDLNMGTNVAGDAINIASAAVGGNVMQIITDGAFGDSVIDIDANTGIWTGNMIEVTTGGNVATGDVMNVNIEAGDVGVQGLVVDNAAASSTDGWLAEVNTTAAWTNNAIDFDVAGAVISTGNLFDVTYSAGAHTGNAVDLNMGTNVAGDAINILAAATTGDSIEITSGAARTDGSAIFITDASVAASVNDDLVAIDVTGTKDTNTIDIDVSGSAATSGNEIDITYSANAHTGNAVQVTTGTNLAGNAIALVGTGVRTGNQIDITTDETGAGDVVDLNINGLKTGNIIDVDLGAVAIASNVLDITMGGTATGDAVSITLGATANQAIVIDATTADPTTTDGVIDINWDSATDASEGINLAMYVTDDAGVDTIIGQQISIENDAITANDNVYGLYINNVDNVTAAAADNLIRLENLDDVTAVAVGLLIQSAAGGITTAIDLTDAEIVTALNVAANDIVGSTGLINYTNFDVSAAGEITVAVGQGLDTNAAGALNLGQTNATSIAICNSAACDSVSIATNVEASNTIAIGNAGDDTLSINGQYFDLGTTGGMTLENSGNNLMLTLDGTNVTTASMIDLNTKNTSGDIINIDYSGATVPTGAVTGIDMDLSNLSGAAQNIFAFHTNTTDDGNTTTIGLAMDGSVEYGIDMYAGGSALIVNTADIRLSNSEVIKNNTDDIIIFAGTAGADNTDLYLDLDGTSPVLYSNTDTNVTIDDSLTITGPLIMTPGAQAFAADAALTATSSVMEVSASDGNPHAITDITAGTAGQMLYIMNDDAEGDNITLNEAGNVQNNGIGSGDSDTALALILGNVIMADKYDMISLIYDDGKWVVHAGSGCE